MEKLKLFLEELGKLFPEKSKFIREQLGIIEDEIKDLKKRNKKLEESIAFSKSDKTKVSYFVQKEEKLCHERKSLLSSPPIRAQKSARAKKTRQENLLVQENFPGSNYLRTKHIF